MNLSIVVPLYKSNKQILNFYKYFKNNIKLYLNNYEINFVCDDPNNKEIFNIVKKINDKKINLIKNKKNYGVSISAHNGIIVSKFDNIFLTQPDITERVNFRNLIKIKHKKNLDFIFTRQFKRKNKIFDSIFWIIFYPKDFFNICITTFFSKKIYLESWKKKDFGINISTLWLRIYNNTKYKTHFIDINKLKLTHKSSFTLKKKILIVLNEIYFLFKNFFSA